MKRLLHSDMFCKHTHEYLVEGFVTQSTQFHEVGQTKHAILDDKTQQLGEWLQKTLYGGRRGGHDVGY